MDSRAVLMVAWIHLRLSLRLSVWFVRSVGIPGMPWLGDLLFKRCMVLAFRYGLELGGSLGLRSWDLVIHLYSRRGSSTLVSRWRC